MTHNRQFPSDVSFLRGRFSFLLISLFFFFLLHSFLAGHPLTPYFLPALLLATLVANVIAFSGKTSIILVASVLALTSLALRWITYFNENHLLLLLIGDGIGGLFFAFIAVNILTAVLRAKTVTEDTISGALCVYLLIGFVWAFLYMMVESVHPGSFSLGEAAKIAAGTAHPAAALFSLFLYFSLTTLSTVAYGDILPLTGPARGLAALEGIAGQFYMAVLVARFVALYIAHSHK